MIPPRGVTYNHTILGNMDIASNQRRLDNTPFTNKNVVSNLHRIIAVNSPSNLPRRPQHATSWQEAVTAHRNRNIPGLLTWGDCPAKITADGTIGLNYGLTTENDVLGAKDYGLSGDFVASVLWRVSLGFRGGWKVTTVWHTVSIYSPLVCFGGMIYRLSLGTLVLGID